MEDTPENKKQFATVMWGIAEDFGGKVSKAGLKMRFESLKKYSIEQIQKAGTWLIENREKDYPPVPRTKEFIEAIEKISGVVSTKAKAEIEADKVFKKLREWGREAEPLFYDQITVYLMTKRWNFVMLDQMTVKDPGLKWFRKEFIEAYIDYAKEEPAIDNLIDNPDMPNRIEASKLKQLITTKKA